MVYYCFVGEFAEGIRVLFQYIPLKVLLKGNISTFIQIAKWHSSVSSKDASFGPQKCVLWQWKKMDKFQFTIWVFVSYWFDEEARNNMIQLGKKKTKQQKTKQTTKQKNHETASIMYKSLFQNCECYWLSSSKHRCFYQWHAMVAGTCFFRLVGKINNSALIILICLSTFRDARHHCYGKSCMHNMLHPVPSIFYHCLYTEICCEISHLCLKAAWCFYLYMYVYIYIWAAVQKNTNIWITRFISCNGNMRLFSSFP